MVERSGGTHITRDSVHGQTPFLEPCLIVADIGVGDVAEQDVAAAVVLSHGAEHREIVVSGRKRCRVDMALGGSPERQERRSSAGRLSLGGPASPLFLLLVVLQVKDFLKTFYTHTIYIIIEPYLQTHIQDHLKQMTRFYSSMIQYGERMSHNN